MAETPAGVFVPTESGATAYHNRFTHIDVVSLDGGGKLLRMRRGGGYMEAKLDAECARHIAALLVVPAKSTGDAA